MAWNRKLMKRIIDFSAALLLLIGLSPLLCILALSIKIKIGSPVFFKQQRPGLYGKSFKMLKFRTMTNQRDASGELLPDKLRMTQFGMFLRSTSLDELPELWNVLKGDMSLVGPRPLLLEYLPLYNARQSKRHELRPGITGWAQINGRNAIDWPRKLEMDVWYVENQSLWLDIKILSATIFKVLLRKDISADGHVTVENFRGNDH